MLDGATVMYGSASELRATLEYDFSQEKDFSYRGLSMDEIIHHLAVFYFKTVANPYFWRGKYENNSGVFHQVSENTWFFCNE